jgi:hypothetical protein
MYIHFPNPQYLVRIHADAHDMSLTPHVREQSPPLLTSYPLTFTPSPPPSFSKASGAGSAPSRIHVAQLYPPAQH